MFSGENNTSTNYGCFASLMFFKDDSHRGCFTSGCLSLAWIFCPLKIKLKILDDAIFRQMAKMTAKMMTTLPLSFSLSLPYVCLHKFL